MAEIIFPDTQIWVTFEDTYDHDTWNFGPFQSIEAASNFCDASNRHLVEQVRKEIGHAALLRLARATSIEALELKYRLSPLAFCSGYKTAEAIRSFIYSQPDYLEQNPEAEARALGCKYEYEWREEHNNGRK